jgi:hypothetical protein
METETHTYTFGYGRNSYFAGSDGKVTRDDGQTITINSYDGYMAVNVKDYSFDPLSELDDETRKMAQQVIDAEDSRAALAGSDPEHGGYTGDLYERLREVWWDDAKQLATEAGFGGVFQAGRSGGWCCIEGTRDLANDFPSAEKPDDLPCYYCDELESEHGDDHTYAADVGQFEVRDRFLALAFDLVGNIDGVKRDVLTEIVREEFAELEAAREANIIRGEN